MLRQIRPHTQEEKAQPPSSIRTLLEASSKKCILANHMFQDSVHTVYIHTRKHSNIRPRIVERTGATVRFLSRPSLSSSIGMLRPHCQNRLPFYNDAQHRWAERNSYSPAFPSLESTTWCDNASVRGLLYIYAVSKCMRQRDAFGRLSAWCAKVCTSCSFSAICAMHSLT